jgi:hypothetical protein
MRLMKNERFLWGFAGSWAVEIAFACNRYEKARPFPARYKKFGFWIVRALLAAFGGLLACAYRVQSELLAIHIGASAPIIIDRFLARPPD